MSRSPRSERPSSCCLCTPLRIGCLILAYFNLIANIYCILQAVLFIEGFVDGPRSTDYIIDILLSVVWLMINIACLVGLHKRCLGFVKVYIGIASLCVILSVDNFVQLLKAGEEDIDTITFTIADLALEVLTFLVYYAYAKQLERENIEAMQQREDEITEIPLSYSSKLDKITLLV